MEDTTPTTLRRYLGELEPGDLLELADVLGVLEDSPAFARLRELVGHHRASVEHRSVKMLLGEGPAASFDDLVRRESLRSVTSGTLRGLEQFERVLDMVKGLAAETRKALGVTD